VSGSGQLFWIEDVTIWNLAGEDGVADVYSNGASEEVLGEAIKGPVDPG
jgi:hypothetical protein